MKIWYTLLILSSYVFAAEVTVDSSKIYSFETVIITANRSSNLLTSSSVAATAINADEVKSMPAVNVTDIISTAPGIVFANRDGLNNDPIASVRGFYGGGEAEYLQILVDGKTINNVESGIANWSMIPTSNIQSIEIIRGGSSSLYGDAAIGGVINILTNNEKMHHTSAAITGSSFGGYNANVYTSGSSLGKEFSLYASSDQISGFRSHSDRSQKSIGAGFSIYRDVSSSIRLSTYNSWLRFDEPGPLSNDELKNSRTQSSSYYRFDRTNERKHWLSMEGSTHLSSSGEINISLNGEFRSSDGTRTILLSPQLGDTKNRVTSVSRIDGAVQYIRNNEEDFLGGKILVGFDVSLQSLASEYYQISSGDNAAYTNAAVYNKVLDEKGDGGRKIFSPYLQFDFLKLEDLIITLGIRQDNLYDSFNKRPPSLPQQNSIIHSVVSPKAGLNYKYINNGSNIGNVYANVSQSFKAPTIDQQFDQRSFTVAFPPTYVPVKIYLSNSDLKPQYGTNKEIGFYHRTILMPSALVGELSLSFYSMNMKDEIDFDISQFKYVNIGKSEHQGVESGLKFYIGTHSSLFINYTYQAAISQSGIFDGKYLKAIPRNIMVTGFTGTSDGGIEGSVLIKSVRDIFMDDANIVPLPDYTTVDVKLSYHISQVSLSVEMFNAFNQTYSTTGYPDPAGTSGLYYYFPSAGRHFRGGIAISL